MTGPRDGAVQDTARRFPNTAAALAAHARERPEATALVAPPRHVSYRQLASDVAAAVGALERAGLAPGMRVGIELRRDRCLHLVLLLACEAIGLTTIAVGSADLVPMEAQADPVLRGCDRLLLADAAPDPLPHGLVVPPAWLADLPPPAPAEIAERLCRPPPDDRLVRIVRTSGTTGRPKAIGMTFAAQQRILDTAIARVAPDLGPHPRFLALYALAIRASVTRVLQTLQCGGSVLFAAREQAPALIAAGVVDHLMFLVGDAEWVADRTMPPPKGHRLHVELVGAPADPALRAMLTERFGAHVTTCYSTNETNLISFVGVDGVGALCPGVAVRIVDEAGRVLPLGEVGLIRVRTEVMTQSYVDDPVASAQAFVDGWYHTNDLGFMPDPAHLVVLGRADDMLNVGGVKILPRPIEARLKQVPGVRDAVLLALERPGRATRVAAALELGDSALTPELVDRLRAIMAAAVPDADLRPVPWFPRTPTGKVRRAVLRESLMTAGEPRHEAADGPVDGEKPRLLRPGADGVLMAPRRGEGSER
ncbi:MAG: hypothetical protein BGO51_17425 [Rhodospirillales bacterium 69-11]|nr:MAG: hypothetical protein BGO51_17425 [Rhodospirillales bacterium 69-11]